MPINVKHNADTPSLAPTSLAMGLDWNLLRMFLVLGNTNSITRAAEDMRLKQPTISNALKRLEKELGCQLAHRDPRNFALTAEGRALHQECVNLFGSIDRLPNLLGERGLEITGHITIAMTSHVISPLLDETLAKLHTLHPKATVTISVNNSQKVLNDVRNKKATLGICLLREDVPDLEQHLFYREHFGFFCGPNHPLFQKKNIPLECLRGENRVSFSTDQLGGALHSVAVSRIEAGLNEKATAQSDNLEEVRRLIVAGLGIGPLPIHVAQTDVDAGRLWPLPPYRNRPCVDIHIITHPQTVLNRAEQAFTQLLLESIAATTLDQRTYGATTFQEME